MKSANEISQMLSVELLNHINNINTISNSLYYNEVLGDTSFLLAGLLDILIKNDTQISQKIWIDDSLINNIELINKTVFIKGVMIWGKENTTEQWVDPFKFTSKFNHDSSNFINYSFFFKDLYTNEISYEEFRDNRNYYSKEIKKWKYKFNKIIT